MISLAAIHSALLRISAHFPTPHNSGIGHDGSDNSAIQSQNMSDGLEFPGCRSYGAYP